VRFPSLFRRSAALVQRRLSPRSRLKRALLRRGLVSGWAAHNRRDFKLMLVRYAPDVEFELARSIQPLGLGGIYHGHVSVVEALGKMAEAWDYTELELHVADTVRVGLDRFVVDAPDREGRQQRVQPGRQEEIRPVPARFASGSMNSVAHGAISRGSRPRLESRVRVRTAACTSRCWLRDVDLPRFRRHFLT
jgi:hypothetical protein